MLYVWENLQHHHQFGTLVVEAESLEEAKWFAWCILSAKRHEKAFKLNETPEEVVLREPRVVEVGAFFLSPE